MESDAKNIHLDDNYVPQDQVETKNEEEWLYEEIFLILYFFNKKLIFVKKIDINNQHI